MVVMDKPVKKTTNTLRVEDAATVITVVSANRKTNEFLETDNRL